MPRRRDVQHIPLHDIARFVDGRIDGAGETIITGVSSVTDAGPGDLAFIAGERFAAAARSSRATAFLVPRQVDHLGAAQVVVDNPGYAFARVVERFFLAPHASRGIADDLVRGADTSIGPDVSIWPNVTLGDRVKLGARVTLYPGVFIGDDCVIGDDTLLYPTVTVREGCTLGSRVVVHSGTVIGSDGFGYVQQGGRHQKIPQIGGVLIEDDVELGANVTVDRATFGQTVIRRGTKIDNLVQVAHNVVIGEDSIVVAQVGIAGSTTLGRGVMVGGQAGIADHVEIGDRVMIAARSGVTRSVEGNQIVSGAPAMPHEQFIKAQTLLPRLPELRQQVRALQHRVAELESALRALRTRKKPRTRKK